MPGAKRGGPLFSEAGISLCRISKGYFSYQRPAISHIMQLTGGKQSPRTFTGRLPNKHVVNGFHAEHVSVNLFASGMENSYKRGIISYLPTSIPVIGRYFEPTIATRYLLGLLTRRCRRYPHSSAP